VYSKGIWGFQQKQDISVYDNEEAEDEDTCQLGTVILIQHGFGDGQKDTKKYATRSIAHCKEWKKQRICFFSEQRLFLQVDKEGDAAAI
jgi:hypothetical protein